MVHRLGFLALGFALKAAANPVAQPDPTPPPDPLPSSMPPNCTTWMTSLLYGFRGDFTPEVAWTVWTSTVTAYSEVPCNGCVLSITTELSPEFGGIGPEERITGTNTPATPTTITSTICSPESVDITPTPIVKPIPKRQAAAASSENCTFTQLVGITGTFGPVKTIYTSTETVTSSVNCSGCGSLAMRTLDPFNPGPVVIFNSTTTAEEPSMTTTYVCQKSHRHSHATSLPAATATSVA